MFEEFYRKIRVNKIYQVIYFVFLICVLGLFAYSAFSKELLFRVIFYVIASGMSTISCLHAKSEGKKGLFIFYMITSIAFILYAIAIGTGLL